MDIALCRDIIWQQFGATLDMLENALHACPDELWIARLWNGEPGERPEYSQYWYRVYHTLFWVDLYLDGKEEGFQPPPPLQLIEWDDGPQFPERTYTKAEMQTYLDFCRRKCRETLEGMSDEKAQQRCRFGWGEASFAELQIYSLRHVQEHAAQLNMFLGQKLSSAPDWVPQAGH